MRLESMKGFYLVKWTLVDWLDRLPVRSRAKARLVDWLDARRDKRTNP